MNSSTHSSAPYPWKRFWRKLDNSSNLEPSGHGTDDQFLEASVVSLYGDEAEIAKGLYELSGLLELPILVLLGRPGSGKSTELERAKQSKLLEQNGWKLIYRQAKEFDGNIDRIFEKVDSELAKGAKVRLVLDGVDELLMENPKFLNILEAGLRQRAALIGEQHKLRVVVSCRAAEWPDGKLANLVTKDAIVVARLCQLDRLSAKSFVEDQLGDGAKLFWAEILKLNITILAVWPHSLSELVCSFKKSGGKLPATLFELIQQSAIRRCDVDHSETDRERRFRLREHRVDPEWLYRVTGRVAALSCFAAKSCVATNPGEGDAEALTVEEILSSPEVWQGHELKNISQEDLDSLKRTAMFEVNASGCLVFAHQLFREFMAAAWLADSATTVSQLKSIFGTEDGEDAWSHFPQLAAIAAWLASHPSQREWREFLMRCDPTVLLRADSASLPNSEKHQIVQALLDRALRVGAIDPSWQHRHLSGLACEGLGQILRPYLLDFREAAEAARDLAIDIVREANVTEAVVWLWEAVRHPSVKLRPDMAYALSEVAINGSDSEWKEVLSGEIPLDSQGALLGAALKVMVPRKLKVSDVLHHLIPKKQFGIIGIYDIVHREMGAFVHAEEAVKIVEHSTRHRSSGFGESWDKTESSLLSRALCLLSEKLESAEAMSAFAEWWGVAILNHSPKPSWDEAGVNLVQMGFTRPSRRRSLINCVLKSKRFKNIDGGDYFWLNFDSFVRLPEDVEWLIEELHEGDDRAQVVLARFLKRAFYDPSVDGTAKDRLLDAYRRNPTLRSVLPTVSNGKSIFEVIREQADAYRKDSEMQSKKAAKERANQVDRQKRELGEFKRQSRLDFDKGDWRAWAKVSSYIFYKRKPSGGVVELDDIDEIHSLGEAWMLEAALRWLRQKAPEFSQHMQKSNLEIPSTWALYVVRKHCSASGDQMPHVDPGWLPYVFNMMMRSGWGNEEFAVEKLVVSLQPESVSAIFEVLLHEYLHDGGMWSVKVLDGVSDRAVPMLKKMLQDNPIQVQGIKNVLGWLAAKSIDDANAVALEWMQRVDVGQVGAEDVALMAAILIHLRGGCWAEVKNLVWHRPNVASKVLLKAFSRVGLHIETELDVSEWPSEYLADLAELLVMTFPHNRDDERPNGEVTARQEVSYARNFLINKIGERGMTGAVRRLEALRLASTKRWLRHVHLAARRADISMRWEPILPSELKALARDHDLILVRNDYDLLRVVLRALEQYERELQQTSHGQALRNDNDGAPKHEESLSDHLAQWLREKLKLHRIRENQTVRQKREDITVLLNRPGMAPLSVCIEVKKDDSLNLFSKMETQLLEDYLKNQDDRTCGIYVVYWFGDHQSAVPPGVSTMEEASLRLAKQAESLSIDPYYIATKVLDCRNLKINSRRRSRRTRVSKK